MAKPLNGELEVKLGDETIILRLGIDELEEIDNATGLGTVRLLVTLADNVRYAHVYEVLRQALPEVNGKKRSREDVKRTIVAQIGIVEATRWAMGIIRTCLEDPRSGNAGAPAETATETTGA